MSIWIPADLEADIRERVASGRYRDDVDVIRAAINALDERDRSRRLRAALVAGDKGDGIPYTPELMAEIEREADDAERQGLALNPDVCP